MKIPEERIITAKEKIEEPKAKTVEIQTIYRYENFMSHTTNLESPKHKLTPSLLSMLRIAPTVSRRCSQSRI